MSAESVIRALETRHLGKRYIWQAAGGGGVHHWLTANRRGPTPNHRTAGLCCFHLPLLAAFETGDLSWDAVGNLIVAQMGAGFTRTFPRAWAPAGIERYYMGTFLDSFRAGREALGLALPLRRGDIVFFSARGAPYFAHVAIATGLGMETISFGHGAALNGGVALPVQRRSILQLRSDFNNLITEVHYGRPPW